MIVDVLNSFRICICGCMFDQGGGGEALGHHYTHMGITGYSGLKQSS